MKFFIDGILTYPVEVKGLTRQFSFIENNYKANKSCEQPGKFLPDTGPKKRSFRAAASSFVKCSSFRNRVLFESDRNHAPHEHQGKLPALLPAHHARDNALKDGSGTIDLPRLP